MKQPPSTESETPRSRAPRILLVEDVADQAFFVRSVLNDYNCEITLAEDGTQAIEALTHSRFDLVLLDLGLPAQSGLDVMIHLKCDGVSQGTPVIITTAGSGSQPVLKILDLYYEKLLRKPFAPRDLVAAIKTLLETKRPEAASA